MRKDRWKIIHWVLIVIFAGQMAYGYYMVFFVGSHPLPLFGQASDMPAEELVLRRLYSIETWLAIGGLAIYLALTEVLPRRLQTLWDQQRTRERIDE
ncbi:MAG: hypothetical protein ACP5JG_18505 [Anaerolineae bacterium]